MSPTDTQQPTRPTIASKDAKKPGLRERKRLQTRAAIRGAALELMSEHGYQDVTVEMICEAADVSRRTFFNYFGSKEAVVIGSDPGPIPEDIQDAFVHGPRGSILADLARMLLAQIGRRPRHVKPEDWKVRLDLIRREPELAKSLADKIAAKNNDLESLVARRIRLRYGASGTPPGEPGDPQDPDDRPDSQSPDPHRDAIEAQIARQSGFIVAMWWGIARYVIQTSVEHPEASEEELIESLLDTLTLIQEAEL